MGVTNTPPTYKCGNCGVYGHNRRTCGVIKNDLLPVQKKTKCGTCGKEGHNKRTCPVLKRRRDFLINIHGWDASEKEILDKAVLTPLTAHEEMLMSDEEEMEEDEVLTSDEEEEEDVTCLVCAASEEEEFQFPEVEDPWGSVDVATEGYKGILLCDDVLDLVGKQVEAVRGKFTRDYHEGRVWMGFLADKQTGMKWSGEGFKILRAVVAEEPRRLGYLNAETDHHVGDTWQECGKQLLLASDILAKRNKTITPKGVTLKYVKREIDFRKNHHGNGWYSWYHTLAERKQRADWQAARRREA